ncbi:twin-arginine translocase subunit TatC [Lacipirellula parvula]|uniref:Sec-independent protein translocase protein TatC n=1 Tax=Lacipirellula parvula TaxID=2650471 RepID=A0A5K7XM66_9BACT|nr:twin-arginine translocase subunit TatC [Lacipirellula parvula]BBO34089.1 hypothetical protein PLANPX_3701 [Lacipirellula parvula]
MPMRPEDEARLEESKMSFGAHLEELRRALFKSIAALFIGFLFGLLFANDIVAYVQTPVRDSLQRFYERQAERQQQELAAELAASGHADHGGAVVTAEEMQKSGLIVSQYLIAPDDLRRLIEEQYPQLKQATPPVAAAAAGEERGADAAAAPAQTLNRDELIQLRLFQPADQDQRLRVVGHSTMEPFSIYIKAAFIAGIVFASPFIFYFIWEFIAAGLYRHEQSYVYTYLPISLGLFIGGALLAFFFAFQPMLDFMLWYFEKTETQPDLQLSDWVSFVLMMPLGFGFSFQLPLVMLLLERIGIFTVESYWSKWKFAIIVIMVLAMVLTPSTDPYSMLLMGVPLVGLYFGGIWLCKVAPGKRLDSPGDLLARGV